MPQGWAWCWSWKYEIRGTIALLVFNSPEKIITLFMHSRLNFIAFLWQEIFLLFLSWLPFSFCLFELIVYCFSWPASFYTWETSYPCLLFVFSCSLFIKQALSIFFISYFLPFYVMLLFNMVLKPVDSHTWQNICNGFCSVFSLFFWSWIWFWAQILAISHVLFVYFYYLCDVATL